jgi:DNA-binding NarL/FixJ family response regulator
VIFELPKRRYAELDLATPNLEEVRDFRYNQTANPLGRKRLRAQCGTILVVDDDDGFRLFVAELLESVGYRTEQLTGGAEVLPAAVADRPAAVVLDVHLPDLSGYEVCRELRDRFGDAVPIIFVSGERTEALDRAAGLLLGADDYMIKPVDPGELIARVRRLVNGGRSPGQLGGASNEKLTSLTQREQEVLGLLGDGYRQDEIALKLVISPNTVGTHIQRILTKLDVRSRTEAVALALRDEEPEVAGHIA